MNTATEDAQEVTSASTDSTTEEIVQAGSTESTADSTGDQADTTPPADEALEDFKADVAKATGTDTSKVPEEKTEAKAETDDTATEKVEPKETEALSQENGKVPENLTERPEWQKLAAIADKVGKAEGKEARQMLRGFYKREYDLNQTIEKSKPAQEVVNEMFQSVGGNEQGFKNMRQLIKNFDVDPAGSVPQLKILLEDAMKRAGMVLQSPELLTESQQLEQQLREGNIDQAAFDKRSKELLELEQVRTTNKRTQAQTQAEQTRQERTQAEQKTQAAAAEINNAESAWVDGKLKSDPDFKAVEVLHSAFAKQNALDFWNKEQRMPSPKESVEILEKSLKQAKDEAAKFRPKPKARQVVTGGSNGSSGNNRQQPQNEYEEFQHEVESAMKRHGR